MKTQQTGKHLFHVGHRKAKKVCSKGNHYGRPLREDVYDAADPMWHGIADCSLCRSTVHRSEFRRAA